MADLKWTPIIYDEVAALSDTERCVRLTDRQLAMLLSVVHTFKWPTRWVRQGWHRDQWAAPEIQFMEEQTAAIEAALLSAIHQATDCGALTETCESNLCTYYFIKDRPSFLRFAPMSPWRNTGIFPPLPYLDNVWTVADANIPLLNLIEGDLYINSLAYPPPPFDAALYLADGFPRFSFYVEGAEEVELEFLAVPQGGAALVSLDGFPLELVDLQSVSILDVQNWFDVLEDIIGQIQFGQTNVANEVLLEVPLPTIGRHEIDVTFIPRISADPTEIGIGGGFRRVGICGDNAVGIVNTEFRLNGCNLEYRNNDDEPWEIIGDVCGPPGEDGADGQPGPPGQDGVDGVDGQQGPPGQDGVDGVDGQDCECGPPISMTPRPNTSHVCAGVQLLIDRIWERINQARAEQTLLQAQSKQQADVAVALIEIFTFGFGEMLPLDEAMGTAQNAIAVDGAAWDAALADVDWKLAIKEDLYCRITANNNTFDDLIWGTFLSEFPFTSDTGTAKGDAMREIAQLFVGFTTQVVIAGFEVFSLNIDNTCAALWDCLPDELEPVTDWKIVWDFTNSASYPNDFPGLVTDAQGVPCNSLGGVQPSTVFDASNIYQWVRVEMEFSNFEQVAQSGNDVSILWRWGAAGSNNDTMVLTSIGGNVWRGDWDGIQNNNVRFMRFRASNPGGGTNQEGDYHLTKVTLWANGPQPYQDGVITP